MTTLEDIILLCETTEGYQSFFHDEDMMQSPSDYDKRNKKLIPMINLAIRKVYTAVPLMHDSVNIDLMDNIVRYTLDSKFALFNSQYAYASYPKYISDSIHHPFVDNVIKVTSCSHIGANYELPLNDSMQPTSVHLPSPNVIVHPNPRMGMAMLVQYQAFPALLKYEKQMDVSKAFVDVELALPAIMAFIGTRFSLGAARENVLHDKTYSAQIFDKELYALKAALPESDRTPQKKDTWV